MKEIPFSPPGTCTYADCFLGLARVLDKSFSWCTSKHVIAKRQRLVARATWKTSTKHVANFVLPLHHSHAPHPHLTLGTGNLHPKLTRWHPRASSTLIRYVAFGSNSSSPFPSLRARQCVCGGAWAWLSYP